MATHSSSASLPTWAPQGFADWAPLAVSGTVILILATALLVRTAADAKSMPNRTVEKEAAEKAPTLPVLNVGTPALSAARVGTLRLVPTVQLPSAKQRPQADAQCPRPALAALSPQANAAHAAGWHVSADETVNGIQFVMVDAGSEKGPAGCAAIGASALVFNAHGLIAIAYDRNAKPSSRLASLSAGQPGSVRLESLRGPLAELIVSDREIGLKPLATAKPRRSSK
ncbi:hypothetical protein [Stenotrophomonas maltophilia]|uniref:hypothetical protein n=1 Tax=Stenotrophomonas maltophilia TaxID=40324 RepID=UPI0013106286|nr:hypothetical protein PGKDCPLP_03269 [Stenotrophomonas maltophilia]